MPSGHMTHSEKQLTPPYLGSALSLAVPVSNNLNFSWYLGDKMRHLSVKVQMNRCTEDLSYFKYLFRVLYHVL